MLMIECGCGCERLADALEFEVRALEEMEGKKVAEHTALKHRDRFQDERLGMEEWRKKKWQNIQL